MLRFRLIDGDINHVIRDLTRILMLEKNMAFKKNNGDVVLDSGNNFFLHPVGDNVYELSHRYHSLDERLEAVGTILEWRGPYKVIADRKQVQR